MKEGAEKGQKLFYRISEIADMIGVNESLLRYWEKEFPQIKPKTNSRGVRLYRQEDIDTIRIIFHLVKERGMTLAGARQKLRDNKEDTIRNGEVINRLKQIREELIALSKELGE